MSLVGRCLVQIDCGAGLFFVGRLGGLTPDLQEALLFEDELAAHIYIDERGLDRLARVRRIVNMRQYGK